MKPAPPVTMVVMFFIWEIQLESKVTWRCHVVPGMRGRSSSVYNKRIRGKATSISWGYPSRPATTPGDPGATGSRSRRGACFFSVKLTLQFRRE